MDSSHDSRIESKHVLLFRQDHNLNIHTIIFSIESCKSALGAIVEEICMFGWSLCLNLSPVSQFEILREMLQLLHCASQICLDLITAWSEIDHLILHGKLSISKQVN